jgi:ATP-dependent protease HslVU (ClpYQ) peptidase subunit
MSLVQVVRVPGKVFMAADRRMTFGSATIRLGGRSQKIVTNETNDCIIGAVGRVDICGEVLRTVRNMDDALTQIVEQDSDHLKTLLPRSAQKNIDEETAFLFVTMNDMVLMHDRHVMNIDEEYFAIGSPHEFARGAYWAMRSMYQWDKWFVESNLINMLQKINDISSQFYPGVSGSKHDIVDILSLTQKLDKNEGDKDDQES